MPLSKVVEVIFTLVMLLFTAIMVLGILIGVTLVQELASFEVGFKGQLIFVSGMFSVFLYIMKMVVDRIREYNRYI